MNVFTVTDACTACGACLATCPERCIRVAPPDPVTGRRRSSTGAPLVVLAEACTGCGECAEVCPVDACVEVEA